MTGNGSGGEVKPRPRRRANAPGHPPRINWQAARAYFLALPENKRSYKAVADKFKVTRERVGQVAKADGWYEALEAVQEAEEREIMRVVRRELRNRAERIARTLDLYDRAADLTLELLPVTATGEIDLLRMREQGIELPTLDSLLGRIPGLFKMAELAAGEATDRVEVTEVQPVLVAFARIAVLNAPPAERGRVLAELEQASAGILELEATAA